MEDVEVCADALAAVRVRRMQLALDAVWGSRARRRCERVFRTVQSLGAAGGWWRASASLEACWVELGGEEEEDVYAMAAVGGA